MKKFYYHTVRTKNMRKGIKPSHHSEREIDQNMGKDSVTDN